MDMVIERLLHEERKMKNRASKSQDRVCYRCGKKGHFKRDCRVVLDKDSSSHEAKFTANIPEDDGALVVGDSAMIAGSLSANRIVDSGATSHMCYDKNLFVTYEKLQKPENVTLGDGRSLSAVGRGTVSLVMKLPDGRTEPRKLLETLHVPDLSFNLSKVSERGTVH